MALRQERVAPARDSVGLPSRGPAVRELGLALPPERMPLIRRGRPLKRWRYVGVYTAEVMLCAGDARIGPLPRRWWAVATPDGNLLERTTIGRGNVSVTADHVRVRARDVEIDLELEERGAVETVSPADGGYIWTRKHGDASARGTIRFGGLELPIEAAAIVDESAGYHDRHTRWYWSAGVGEARSGARVAWNLVTGIHDDAAASERTLWVDGEPQQLGPARFADDLSGVAVGGGGELRFEEWSAREDHANLLVMRNSYRQPFGTFRGSLPGAGELAAGYGVMEEHDVLW